MEKRRLLRLIALLLSVLMLLQCAAAADPFDDPPAEPGQTEQTEPGDPADPVNPGQPDPGDPAEDPDPIVITCSLTDGEVVNNPNVTFTVSAEQAGGALPAEQLTVKLGSAALTPTDGEYAAKLKQGDNQLTITAVSGEQTQTLTLAVRYEIAIPAGWASKALAFCVKNGILKGDQNGDLKPTDNATRAELAAMLVRLFQAKPMDSLAGFTDVPESQWFHDEMAKAVAMGIFKGSGDKLNPKNRITREEAFVVLARAFGVAAATDEALDKAPDKAKVSNWARSSLAAMLEAGYINGYTDGALKPKGYITRQELAQVLYNALDCITDDPDELTGSRCLYTGPATALEGKKIDGSLIVSSPDTEDLTLNDLQVSGRLVLHLHEVGKATLGSAFGEVSVCSPTKVTLTAPVKTARCLRDGAALTADAELVIVDGKATLHGTYDRAVFLRGKSTVAKDAEIGAAEANASLTVNGKIGELSAPARGVALKGSGRIETLYQYYNDLTVECEVGQTVDRVDAGLEGVQVVQTDVPDVYYDATTVTVTGKVTGVNNEQVYGVGAEGRLCTVTYQFGGKVVKTEQNFRLTEGAKLSCEVAPTLRYQQVEEQTVTVTISYRDETVTGALKLRANGKFSPLHEAKNILTCYVTAEIRYSTGLYAYSSLSGYIGSLSAGTIVNFLNDNGSSALVMTSGGQRGFVPSSAVRVGWRDYTNQSISYSTEGKEAFVNELHDYSSSTDYLIWINLYTTNINIFKGSKGNWKLLMDSECAIGAPNTPTRQGVYSIYSKTYYWTFDDSRCYYVSLFDGGIATHSRLKYINTGAYVNASLSQMLSHGCVRCPDEIAQFIYNNCPIGTRVVVY